MKNIKQIKQFIDGSSLAFAQGRFDNWCVYMIENDGKYFAPLDVDYFHQINDLSLTYGIDKIYSDFVKIYDSTDKKVNDEILQEITKYSKTYEKNKILNIDKLFTILYMTLVSEENCRNTRLGKRIKRLGIYEMLYSGRTVEDAANFMRGMSWKEIDALCKERGF